MKAAPWLLFILLAAAPATAQGNLTDEDIGSGALDALDQALDGVSQAVEGVGDAVQATGEGIRDGASAVGRFLGRAATALGHAVSATFQGLATAGAVTALGIGSLVAAVGGGLGTLLVSTGSGATSALVWTGSTLWTGVSAVGGGIAWLGGAYADLIGALRPDRMPPIVFGGVVAAGATASTGVGGWAGWNVLRRWGALGGGLAGVGGFSRIQDSQLLEHPVRQQIFETIQSHPGIHASHLAREVGVGWGTVSHHLDKLDRARLVTSRKVNNQKCYFENGGDVSRGEMEVASAVKGDTASRIAAFVHHHPMTSQKAMAESLGISPALASFHAKKLVNLGVLEKVRHGKESLLTTSGAMRRLLEADRDLMASMEARAADAMEYSA